MHRALRPLLIAGLLTAVVGAGLDPGAVSAEPGRSTTGLSLAESLVNGPTVVEDFSGGVAADNHPLEAGQYRVWYDATDNAFATPSASTVDGTPAMRIDDGGFTNGVYVIYPAVVPATGQYTVEAELGVIETGAVDAIRAYQVGAAAGADAAHRGPNPSALASLDVAGSYEGLTSEDDTAAGPQVVSTSPFTASAGDDLLIAFGTDVTSGAWNLSSGAWSGSHVVVTEIRLVPVDQQTIVVDNDDGPGAYEETGSWITSGVPGFDGGTYRFTSTGNDSTATWTAQLSQAGSYDVEVIYVAGANRATSASYDVVTADGVVTMAVDQTTPNLAWVELGTFELPAGSVSVTLDAAASQPSSTVVIADAVRFVPSTGPPPIDDPEMRLAVITVFDDIDDTDSIQRTVTLLQDLHYNAIAVHARFRGDATYFPNKSNSDFPNQEPRHPAAGDVDVLQEFTERGHAAGMKVFAYVNTHLVTGITPEDRPNHVVNRHPDWITYEYNGGDPIPQVPGEGLWLEPALPQVTRYLARIAGDIMSNYDSDGIILDRIRYPQTNFTRETLDFGYHPDAIRRFNLLYRKQGVPDPNDPDWIAFRQRAITRAVTVIYRTITDIDPKHVLLAYPIGRLDDAIEFNYQDWPTWLHRNVIDGVLPQIYDQDPAGFAARLARHRGAYQGDRLLGVTLDAFRPDNDLAGRIELVRQADYDGTSPFRHGVMGLFGYFDDLERAWDGVAQWPDQPGKGESIRRLDVRSDPDRAHQWIVSNPNSETLHLTWVVLGTKERGALYAQPGETKWQTATTDHPSVIVVRWYDDKGRPRFDIAVSAH